jgi:long-chain acyl-CoA synthetase
VSVPKNSVAENKAIAAVAQLAEMPNLVSLFLARAAEQGEAPFLSAKRDGAWVAQSWRAVADQVCLLAQALRGLGLNPGDRVMLVSENRPEWCIADIAIMAAGLVTVPTYTTNTARDHLHILENSGARAIIVSNAKLAQPLLAAALTASCAEHVIGMEPLRQQQAGTLHFHDWDALVQGDAGAARAAVAERLGTIRREDLACIIYTSGTGGAPRGVRQHHGAILANVAGAATILAEDFHLGDDQFLSFLPLSHAYEHTGGQWLPIGVGARIAYAEGLEKLASNIEEVRPTIMVVVPRLFEVLRARIIKQIEKQGRLANWLMDRALAIAAHQEQTGHLRLIDRPLNLLIERTLRPKVRARFGGRIKALVSGGAPLNPEVGLFFEAMGLTMLQGYGQTEAGPVIACNRPAAGIRMDTVGPPLAGVDVQIAPDGEILVRGELVMHGYWHNDAETARAIQDGWLHTGDIGHIDSQGRIKITDRKKDMIVNDKGDNVSPQRSRACSRSSPKSPRPWSLATSGPMSWA